MTILQILPALNIGGVERGCVDLARELVRRKHQALVISNGGSLVPELESAGGRHFRLSVHRKSLFSILANIPRVSRIIQEQKVDLVHARSRIPALIAFLACRRSGTNFITTCHGYYSQHFFSQVMGWGKFVIVSSAAIAQHMIRDFAVPPERIKFIPRGVDLQEFQFQPKNPRPKHKSAIFTVGVIGRLTPIKGHKYFLQALARVNRVFPGVRGLIVGDISPGKEKYQEELKMLTRRLSLDRYVEFVGRQNNIPQVLARLDALVLPTITQEAFGRVLIEAAACGVPVIATRVGGIVDIVEDGVNGILVQPKNAGELASAIFKLIEQPEFAQKLKRSARKAVEEKFSLEQMAERTIKVYEQAQAVFKILVIKLTALGDVILAGPSLKALRQHFPRAQISVLVARPNQSVLANCPYTNQVFEVDKKGGQVAKLWADSGLLRRLNFDLIVDLQNSRRSHLLAYLSGSARRYGYDNGKLSFLLNHRVKSTKLPISPIQHQARTLQLLGIGSVKDGLELWPQDSDQKWADAFLQQQRRDPGRPLIGLNLGASLTWPTKRWGLDKFAQLCAQLNQAGIQVMVTGKAWQKQGRKKFVQLCQHPFIDAVEKTSIMQLACLIKRCDLYISSDSAPLHIACALHTPAVALFGPTDPRRHIVANSKQVVIRKDIACSPCYKKACRKHTCMQELEVAQVFSAVKLLLR